VNWLGGIVRIALKSLWANKLRTVLTTIGVIIGIGTIIGMLSLINGINQSVEEEFSRLGPDVVYLTRDEPGIHVGTRGAKARKRITLAETEKIRRRAGSIGKMSILSDGRGNVGFRGQRSGVITVRGVSSEYVDVGKVAIDQGRFFTEAEDRSSMVCVLGAGVVKGVFGKISPVGKEVDIEGRKFQVVGTLEATGVVFGNSSDDVALVPYRAARTVFGESDDSYVMALPREGVKAEDAMDDLRVTVRVIRKIPPGTEDGFALSTQQSLLETYNKLTGSIYWVMRIVASIALLVSGIGIMNIMLVVVMERTREIGLRKAIGATRKAIMGQFLVEAVILTLIGGAVGIALGFLIRVGVAAGTPLPASVPIWAVPMALGICCAVGIFFGAYPALRASGLDPVEALRYE
jgi:putative ABC transport system permease protein